MPEIKRTAKWLWDRMGDLGTLQWIITGASGVTAAALSWWQSLPYALWFISALAGLCFCLIALVIYDDWHRRHKHPTSAPSDPVKEAIEHLGPEPMGKPYATKRYRRITSPSGSNLLSGLSDPVPDGAIEALAERLRREIVGKKAAQKPEKPIWEAVQYVASAIGDTNEHACYPEAIKAIRQAASDGHIEIWGRRELPPPNQRGHASEIWTLIPASYWADHKINSMAVGEAWQHHDHSYGEPLNIHAQDRYWELKVRMSEIEREWPSEQA